MLTKMFHFSVLKDENNEFRRTMTLHFYTCLHEIWKL